MDDIRVARSLFETTMGFNIINATFCVGLPLMILAAELLYQKTNDKDYAVMPKRWTKAFAVTLGVGIPPSIGNKSLRGLPRVDVIMITLQYLAASYVYRKAYCRFPHFVSRLHLFLEPVLAG